MKLKERKKELLQNIRGVITALITPFKGAGESVDYRALRELVNWQIESGIDGLFPAGTSGEGVLLSMEERKKMAEIICEETAGRIPIVYHVGDITTAASRELAVHCAGLGVDAVSAITPYYYTVGDKEIINHYIEIAASIPDTPFFLYNNPAKAINVINNEILLKVKERCENVVGIKDSSKSIDNLKTYKKCLQPEDILLVGGDEIFKDALAVGAAGAISTISNVFPRKMRAIYEAWLNDDQEEIEAAQTYMNKILKLMKEYPYFAACKAVLEYKGLPGGTVRSPIGDLSQAQRKELIASLKELNAIK